MNLTGENNKMAPNIYDAHTNIVVAERNKIQDWVDFMSQPY